MQLLGGLAMKKYIATLGVALIATLGAASVAQAAVVDFGAASSGTVTYTGASLSASSALDLTSAAVTVTTVGSDDTTGVTLGTPVTFVPLDFSYGTGSGTEPIDLVKTWTVDDTTYTETLDEVTIFRIIPNTIILTFTGELTGGAFDDSPATLILTANQARGPGVGHAVALAFTNAASTVPEPSTWAMMVLGFVGLGYAALRRNSKSRAIAV
jgi:hypothetical protein